MATAPPPAGGLGYGHGPDPSAQPYPYNPAQAQQPFIPPQQQPFMPQQQTGVYPHAQQQPVQHQQPVQQQQQHQQPQVIVQVIQNQNLYSSSTRVVCQYCHADIKTRVTRRTNLMTHLTALILCIFCCPLFWIPYCCDCTKDTIHECPNCNRFLGEYRPQDNRRRY